MQKFSFDVSIKSYGKNPMPDMSWEGE